MSDIQGPPERRYDDWTAGAVVQFCDMLAAKKLVKQETAGSWKTSFSKVMALVEEDGWEEISVKDFDLDLFFERFENAAKADYTSDTLATYKKRFRNALDEYRSWIESPSTYRPKVTTRRRRTKQEREQQAATPATNGKSATSSQPSRVEAVEENVDTLKYPFPVRPGVVATFDLPPDLRPDEADRIGKFIASLAVRAPAGALPSGEEESEAA